MADPVWGQLAYSQDNNELIEEAIDRKIGDHNDNPDSHLEAGQSLQSHKAAEIIDHVARSVVRDKILFDKFTIDEHFSSIDAWKKSAGVTLSNVAEVTIQTTGTLNNTQYLYAQPGDSIQDQSYNSKSPYWETRVKIFQNTNQEIYIILGDPDIPAGHGFKIVNGNLYAVYWNTEGNEILSQISGINITAWNDYKCELIYGGSLKWYVNGILKHEIAANLAENAQMFIFYRIKTTASEVKTMYVQNYHFEADYSA